MTTTNTIEKTDVLLKGTFSISPEEYAPIKEKTFNVLAQGVTLPGFRAGKAPKQMLVDRIGEGRIMDETARRAIEDFYPKLIGKEGVRPVGDPRISITKCAAGNPIEFTVEVPLYPPIKLPDYKKIANTIFSEKRPETTVDENEIDEAILNIKKYRQEKLKDVQEETLIDDAFAQTLGNFKNLADLKEKMKENLLLEKNQKEKNSVRHTALLKIIESSTFPISPQLIDAETQGMMLELKENTASYGLDFKDYLSHSKKTEEELVKDMRGSAESHIREEFIVHEIAEKESLRPTKEELDENTKAFLEARPNVTEHDARRYVSELLIHEKVYQFLEDGVVINSNK